MISYDELAASVQGEMPLKRWIHTQGVITTSIQLAEKFDADPDKARIAATLHDVAKFWPIERQREVIMGENAQNDVLLHDPQLWHAHAGAIIAEQKYGILDPDILHAIRYHTSGRVGMSLLEKVVCLADYIEPGRDFAGVEQLRILTQSSLEQALIRGLGGTIVALTEKDKPIYPLTVFARNDLIQQINRRTTDD
jgi:predicted HD superfamily hydrolase involved in NAD metabolism